MYFHRLPARRHLPIRDIQNGRYGFVMGVSLPVPHQLSPLTPVPKPLGLFRWNPKERIWSHRAPFPSQPGFLHCFLTQWRYQIDGAAQPEVSQDVLRAESQQVTPASTTGLRAVSPLGASSPGLWVASTREHRASCDSLQITLNSEPKCLKQPKCPWTDDRIKKLWYIYTTEYYPAIKKNEIMPFAATWMDLEIIILSEVMAKTKSSPFVTSDQSETHRRHCNALSHVPRKTDFPAFQRAETDVGCLSMPTCKDDKVPAVEDTTEVSNLAHHVLDTDPVQGEKAAATTIHGAPPSKGVITRLKLDQDRRKDRVPAKHVFTAELYPPHDPWPSLLTPPAAPVVPQ
ncbi:60S ribosomal protein L26 [Camelus dromedarius]|uniref:60S ribosomal protein L26 n=1 Tax=Camelus dromedarius TaxID=9838 RepID=A0A5N4D9B5_CAMDR|nr:60S ribosomal protein L26 [Camelus dromedarius]